MKRFEVSKKLQLHFEAQIMGMTYPFVFCMGILFIVMTQITMQDAGVNQYVSAFWNILSIAMLVFWSLKVVNHCQKRIKEINQELKVMKEKGVEA